jgi:hypothetical protein
MSSRCGVGLDYEGACKLWLDSDEDNTTREDKRTGQEREREREKERALRHGVHRTSL